MSATTETGAQKDATEVEGIVNALMPAAAAFGPAGVAASAGVKLAENVTNAILSATASHEAPLAIATGAATALASNAAPLVAAMPVEVQVKANAGLTALQEALAVLKGIFGL